MPKIFRMTKGGKINADIFTGATINTPSMLANEDYIDALVRLHFLPCMKLILNCRHVNCKKMLTGLGKINWGLLCTRWPRQCQPCSDRVDGCRDSVDGIPVWR